MLALCAVHVTLRFYFATEYLIIHDEKVFKNKKICIFAFHLKKIDMPTKPYDIPESEPVLACEPAVAYVRCKDVARNVSTGDGASTGNWGPNAMFNGTQEEFLEHIHRIEEGEFNPVTEVHQRISQWLWNQKK